MTSPRLCGGILVAMPTAMPPAPLTRRLGKRAGHDRRLALLAVVIGLEVDGALIDVLEQRERGLGEPRLGVAHRPRADRRRPSRNCPARRSAAARIEKSLRHAHQRVIDREIAVRMVFAHHVADDARRLHMRLDPAYCRSRSSKRGCADARASGRRARRAARGSRSRSSRNRDRIASFRRRWRPGECRSPESLIRLERACRLPRAAPVPSLMES